MPPGLLWRKVHINWTFTTIRLTLRWEMPLDSYGADSVYFKAYKQANCFGLGSWKHKSRYNTTRLHITRAWRSSRDLRI